MTNAYPGLPQPEDAEEISESSLVAQDAIPLNTKALSTRGWSNARSKTTLERIIAMRSNALVKRHQCQL